MKIADKINTLDSINLGKRNNFKRRLGSKPLLPDIVKLINDIEKA